VRVSQQKMDEKLRAQLLERLLTTVSGPRNGSGASVFCELLSEEERLAYAKRLAIVVMRSRGVRCRVIAQALCVSLSTVSYHSARLRAGAYASIERRSKTKRAQVQITQFVEDMLEIALMPYCGEGRKKVWQKYAGRRS